MSLEHPQTGYEYRKRWRYRYPDRRRRERNKHYRQFTHLGTNRYRRWDPLDDQRVLDHRVPDRQLAALLGRSLRAIHVHRVFLWKFIRQLRQHGIDAVPQARLLHLLDYAYGHPSPH